VDLSGLNGCGSSVCSVGFCIFHSIFGPELYFPSNIGLTMNTSKVLFVVLYLYTG
jgi:hypothetical protein